mmetsp:Transcript_374/g.1508  ORF Transcript_374/g.1508 Transcript_374/m.1508 type:complete len:204 (+) Transcript_374:209-820(+)
MTASFASALSGLSDLEGDGLGGDRSTFTLILIGVGTPPELGSLDSSGRTEAGNGFASASASCAGGPAPPSRAEAEASSALAIGPSPPPLEFCGTSSSTVLASASVCRAATGSSSGGTFRAFPLPLFFFLAISHYHPPSVHTVVSYQSPMPHQTLTSPTPSPAPPPPLLGTLKEPNLAFLIHPFPRPRVPPSIALSPVAFPPSD